MSWFLGIIRKTAPEVHCWYKAAIQASFSFSYGNVHLLAGGTRGKNIVWQKAADGSFFVAAGLGISANSEKQNFFGEDEWSSAVREASFRFDGHYCGVFGTGEYINLFTDPIGLRDIYLLEQPDQIVFSTRLDLMAMFTDLDLDFSIYGSSWLCVNKLTNACSYKGITRLIAGSQAKISLREFTVKLTEHPWYPRLTGEKISVAAFTEKLGALLRPRENRFILGLSGGLDSRTLVSLIAANDVSNWSMQTTGPNDDADCRIASELAKSLPMPHIRIPAVAFTGAPDMDEIRKFCFLTFQNHPVSSWFAMKTLDAFDSYDAVFVDGGFGEIWRREYFNRILWTAKEDLVKQNPVTLAPKLISCKSDIFSSDVQQEMKSGCIKQIDKLFQLLPPVSQVGLENWLDLLAIKTRIPNYCGPEQARLDERIISFMPFLQVSLLENLFSIPPELRKNGKLFKQIITSTYPAFAKVHLAKGAVTLPFSVSTFTARVLLLLKKRLNRHSAQQNNQSLQLLREFALDIAASSDLAGSAFYDHQKIRTMAEQYYIHGDTSYATALEWFLTFELAQQYIRGLGQMNKR